MSTVTKNDPDNYLTVGKAQKKIASERGEQLRKIMQDAHDNTERRLKENGHAGNLVRIEPASQQDFNVFKAKAISRGKLLERFRSHMQDEADYIDAEEMKAEARRDREWEDRL